MSHMVNPRLLANQQTIEQVSFCNNFLKTYQHLLVIYHIRSITRSRPSVQEMTAWPQPQPAAAVIRLQ